MNYIYRTNKYKLPLLHILGCTNLQTYFSAGFCFLRNETQHACDWAVFTFLSRTGISYLCLFVSDQEDVLKAAARELFLTVPQLLCVLYINLNVQTKAQLVWRDADGIISEERDNIVKQRAQSMTG
jgi:hypothetical protein